MSNKVGGLNSPNNGAITQSPAQPAKTAPTPAAEFPASGVLSSEAAWNAARSTLNPATDIDALASQVLMQSAKSAREDLKAIMAQVKAINNQKTAQHSAFEALHHDTPTAADPDPEKK